MAQMKRSDRETVVTLRLPRDLHERLKEAGGERGLTTLIRSRLQASLEVGEAPDEATRELLTAIRAMASALPQVKKGTDRVGAFARGLSLLCEALHPKPESPDPSEQYAIEAAAYALAAQGIAALGVEKRFEAYVELMQKAEALRNMIPAAREYEKRRDKGEEP